MMGKDLDIRTIDGNTMNKYNLKGNLALRLHPNFRLAALKQSGRDQNIC